MCIYIIIIIIIVLPLAYTIGEAIPPRSHRMSHRPRAPHRTLDAFYDSYLIVYDTHELNSATMPLYDQLWNVFFKWKTPVTVILGPYIRGDVRTKKWVRFVSVRLQQLWIQTDCLLRFAFYFSYPCVIFSRQKFSIFMCWFLIQIYECILCPMLKNINI